MAEYKDIDEILKKLPDDLPYKASVKRVLIQAPAADIVPRSEVKELIRENESLAKTVNEASELIRKLRSKVEKSKTEVAREIFAEIENIFGKHMLWYRFTEEQYQKYEKLKKKYMEG